MTAYLDEEKPKATDMNKNKTSMYTSHSKVLWIKFKESYTQTTFISDAENS